MDDTRRLLRKAARNQYRVLEEPRFWTPAFCSVFFEWCDEQAYEAPDSVLVRGQLALELATKTGDRHSLAKAHGAMASAYRRVSVPSQCEFQMQAALKLAGSCSCCLSDIYRRLGGILIFQLRFQEASDILNEGIAHYKELGNEDGIGRSLISRGVALWRMGQIDVALEDERKALQLLAPDAPEFFYVAALTNTAHFLATGEDRHRARAEPFLDSLRAQLVGVEGMTAVRILLSWTHGLILASRGDRKRALQMLRTTRKRLLHRRQDAEVVAITADISQLYCDTRKFHYIVDLTRDCLARLRDISGTRDLLKNVLLAAERELDETRAHLVDLRAAVTVSIPALSAHPSLESIAAP